MLKNRTHLFIFSINTRKKGKRACLFFQFNLILTYHFFSMEIFGMSYQCQGVRFVLSLGVVVIGKILDITLHLYRY